MREKVVIRIAFVDFWDGFNPAHLVKRLFSDDYEVIHDPKNPDLLIYSCFGENHLEYMGCKSLFFCGENIVPDFNTCDYAISTVKVQYENRCLWIPCSYFSLESLNKVPIEITPDLVSRRFCSFIYSQDKQGVGARLRKEFCQQLMQAYKRVDCPGKILNNMESSELTSRTSVEDWHSSKVKFLSNYKFNIAFENSQAPGYITEKLTDCYLANTVPIYWGSSGDVFPYPKDSLICANDYSTIDDLIARVREVDENDELYLSILKANPFRGESHNSLLDYRVQLHRFVDTVVNGSIQDKGLTLYTDAHRCFSYMQRFRQRHIQTVCKLSAYIRKICNFFK